MVLKLNNILLFGLLAFFLAWMLYPVYIKILKYYKIKKTIREDDVTGQKSKIFQQLHAHKAGIPTMGGGMFLFIVGCMVLLSYILQKFGCINGSLLGIDRLECLTYNLIIQPYPRETLLLLFGFFSMGLIGLLDDILNVLGIGKVKGLSAQAKMIGMILFAGFISYWFYQYLGIDYINFRPFAGEISLGIGAPIIFFFLIIMITNAINFTDGLDGLAGGLMGVVFFVLAIVTFTQQKYLSATILVIMISVLMSFLMYNINPAKIIMGDSGAFSMGGLLSVTILLLNAKIGIFVPFMVLFGLFWVEFFSSALQIASKKIRKKKLFPIAPFHHYLEYKGRKEHTIVMKFRFVQTLLATITLIGIFYQLNG